MYNTGSNFGGNAPQDPNAPPSYQDPNAPPNYQAANGTASYSNPPGYAQPPNVGGGDMGYQPPQIGNNQPTYAQPPVGNPDYAQPPVGNPTYAQPPVGNPNYAQPPVDQNGRRVVRPYTYSLCDCFVNCKYCLYVFCCFPCALGEMRTAFDGKSFHFWLTVITLSFCWSLFYVSPYLVAYNLGQMILYLIYNGIATFFLMELHKDLSKRLSLQKEDDCTNCILSWCCGPCKLSQMGNELTQYQRPEVRELVLNVQRASPCGQACMNNTHLTVVQHGAA